MILPRKAREMVDGDIRWKNGPFDDPSLQKAKQKNLKTITRREHKHPRIEAYVIVLLCASQFVARGGVDIHVPDRHVNQPVAVD
jgi:hypothetical protein